MYQFNQMRRLRFLPLGLIVLMSCAREEPVDTSGLEKGEVVISLSTDAGSTDVKPQMKSVDENAPESPDDFEVEIYNSKGIRLYRDTYANSVGRKIALNTGEYRLLAQYGDSAGVGFGSEKAWFSADREFTVEPQSETKVEAVAKMNKVKVAVIHGANIRATYADWYSIVRQEGKTKELKFGKDETRAGYIPAGKLVYELYVKNGATGKWLYCQVDAKEYKPNTFVTFNVDYTTGEGSLGVSITIDDNIEEKTEEYKIPFEAAPQEKPTVSLVGFDGSGSFSFVEGVRYEDVKANIVSKGKIKDCILTHDSQYLKSMNIPESVNLADPALDAEVASALKSLGFKWPRKMRGERFGNVDFAYLSDYVKYSPEAGLLEGNFTLSVTDEAGNTVESPVAFHIVQQNAAFSFEPQPYNAFARRISGLKAELTSGAPEALIVQYRKKGGEDASWKEVVYESSEVGVLFNDITGLEPGTEYEVRAIYNENENIASAITTLTTESALQVGNAGFEEWTEESVLVYTKPLIGGGEVYQTKFNPWASDVNKWWNTNNDESIITGLTLVSSNLPYRTFPVVRYVQGYGGEGKAAQIISACIGDFNTNSTTAAGTRKTVAGKLFIPDGGHAFNSRPSKLVFYYKYLPRLDDSHSSDTFRVLLQIKNGDTVIGTVQHEMTYSKEVGWTRAEVEVIYSDKTVKADKIFIEIRQSTSDDPVYNIDVPVPTYDGSINAHAGSILTIDDIELIYE